MNDIVSPYTTKDKIISATLNIIDEAGIQNVTIRKIANLANVNIAAVNYHFGSKDRVINEALKYVTIQMKKTFEYLRANDTPPIIRLRNFLLNYADTAVRYPEILKNFIAQTMYDYNLRAEYEIFLKVEGVELIKQTLQEIMPEKDDYILYMKVFQILSTLSYPVLLGHRKVADVMSVNYGNLAKRHEYVELLLKSILSI